MSPKTLAKDRAEQLACSFAPALKALIVLFTPINWIDRGYNSLIYFAKEAFGALNPDILLRLCDCFTCNGKQINHSSLKSRSSYVYRNKDQWDFVPVIDGIIARARKK